MTRSRELLLILVLVGATACSASGGEPSSTTAESLRALGAEESKLLHGQPSVGFLPPAEVNITAVRAEFGVNAVSPGVLIWDEKAGAAPPNWRATDALPASVTGINATGLAALHIAGSGQYNKAQFATATALAARLHKPLTVLHLRSEPTGFIGDKPFSMYGFANLRVTDWSNAGLDDDRVEERNKEILNAVAHAASIVLYDKAALKAAVPTGKLPAPQSIAPAGVSSEEDLVESMGANFEGVRITDHGIPTFDAVDDLVDTIVEAKASGALLYAHCAGGDGRTTTVMSMADMLQNANAVSIADIFKRQTAIGGEDMTDVSDTGARGVLQKARLDLLTKFYAYAKANPNGQVKFSRWAGAHGFAELKPSYGL